MRFPIAITGMLLFSILYFSASFITSQFPENADGVMETLNFLTEFHIFELSLVITAITSIYGNYKRTTQNGNKLDILKITGLFGYDYSAMLMGVLASQFVFMFINFSSNDSMHGLVATFTVIAIILNLSRTTILDKMVSGGKFTLYF